MNVYAHGEKVIYSLEKVAKKLGGYIRGGSSFARIQGSFSSLCTVFLSHLAVVLKQSINPLLALDFVECSRVLHPSYVNIIYFSSNTRASGSSSMSYGQND